MIIQAAVFIPRLVKTTLVFIGCTGLLLVLAQIKPFWVDEWRIIYNLKFKSFAALWGPLDYMQQAPRAYLTLLKALTAPADYSYFSLRLPSFLTGMAIIGMSYRLVQRIYQPGDVTRYLFVAIIISCYTFTEYFVQVKQYTMDILLSIAAIWQLLQLLKLAETASFRRGRYVWLCILSGILPFFSYTYPIALAPVYGLLIIQSLRLLRSGSVEKRLILLRQWLPLVIAALGIVLFYVVDVRQLMADRNMQDCWADHLVRRGYSWQSFMINIYSLFAQAGSGFVFEHIFAALGLSAAVYGARQSIRAIRQPQPDLQAQLCIYSTMLLLCVLILYSAGRLPVGEPRLTVFTMPAIAYLNTRALAALLARFPRYKLIVWAPVVLYLGVLGNVYSSFIGVFTDPDFAQQLKIYEATEDAIILASHDHTPIAVTPGVAFPYDNTPNLPLSTTIPGDWVLKTFPAYKIRDSIPILPIADISEWKKAHCNGSDNATLFLAGNGLSYAYVQCK